MVYNETVHHGRRYCTEITPECPLELTTYGYYPNLSINSFFVALFGICLFLQLGLGIWRRTWTWLVVLGIGCFGEAGMCLCTYFVWRTHSDSMDSGLHRTNHHA